MAQAVRAAWDASHQPSASLLPVLRQIRRPSEVPAYTLTFAGAGWKVMQTRARVFLRAGGKGVPSCDEEPQNDGDNGERHRIPPPYWKIERRKRRLRHARIHRSHHRFHDLLKSRAMFGDAKEQRSIQDRKGLQSDGCEESPSLQFQQSCCCHKLNRHPQNQYQVGALSKNENAQEIERELDFAKQSTIDQKGGWSQSRSDQQEPADDRYAERPRGLI